MSVDALNALRSLNLLDEHYKVRDFSSTSAGDLQKRLDYYYSDRSSGLDRDAKNSIPSSRDMAAVMSSVSTANAILPVLPSCFVYNRVYLNDPLSSLKSQSDIAKTHNESLGMNPSAELDKSHLENKLLFFEKLAPLIKIGAVHILPIASLNVKNDDAIPIFYSEDWFRSEVPQHVHDFVHSHAIINEVAPAPGNAGLLMHENPPQQPTRGISISFKNDTNYTGMQFYLLYDQEIIERIDESHFLFSQKLDWDNPPEQDYFDAWVYQSINRTIINRMSTISREIGLASELKASYITESQFEAEVCGLSSKKDLEDNQLTNAVKFLEANAPYINIQDPIALTKLREKNSKLFERWQLSLLNVSDELSNFDGDFSLKSKQLFEKEVRPQIAELQSALLKSAGGATGAALLTAGTIGLAVLSGPVLPFAAVLGLGAVVAAGRTAPNTTDYLAKRKGPAFIWNKLTK